MKSSAVSLSAVLSINFLIYGFNALFGSLLPPYFTARFSPAVAGALLSIGPLVAIFAPLIWGMISDRAQNKNRVMMVTVLGSGIFFLLIGQTRSIPLLSVLLFLTMFFMSPFGGLVDLLTLNACGQLQKPYGPCRVLGTIGFGLVAIFGDLLMAKDDSFLFYLVVGVSLLSLLALWLMPQHQASTKTVKLRGAGANFFKNRTLVVLTIIISFAHFTWSYCSNFCSQYMSDTLHAPDGAWGAFVLLSAFGEIPFFLFFDKIFKRIKIDTMLWVSILVMALRWFLLAFITNIPLFLLVAFVTGLFVTIITYAATLYIKEHIIPQHQATSLTLLYALGNGISKTLAGLVGGIMTQYLNFNYSILLCSGLMLLCVLYYLGVRKKCPDLR